MIFDILQYSDEELEKLSVIQMQLLRTAQRKKDELTHSLERDIEDFKAKLLANDMYSSNLLDHKTRILKKEYDYRVDILREQLVYNMKLNEPYPGEGSEEAGYIVDYSLTYTERYKIVKAYYLAIEDPVERMNLYRNDDVARRYLGEYYTTLYNVLYGYSS